MTSITSTNVRTGEDITVLGGGTPYRWRLVGTDGGTRGWLHAHVIPTYPAEARDYSLRTTDPFTGRETVVLFENVSDFLTATSLAITWLHGYAAAIDDTSGHVT